jgi:hypothetical protein
MKYLLVLVAVFAFVASATATDCCNGGACCLVHLSCCAE